MSGSGIGTALGGLSGALIGALLSIPLVAMGKAIFVYYFEKKTGRRIVAEDGVFFKGAAMETDEVDPIADATAPTPVVNPGATGAFPSLTSRLPIIELEDDDGDSGDHPAHRK